jgi:hypothetical protein
VSGRFVERADRGASVHAHARSLAAERLDSELDPEASAWLDVHLGDCTACGSHLEALQADRLELRGLRRQTIEPPRDLWARTAAAIERDARIGGTHRRAPLLRRRRPSPAPLGALSGLFVIVAVFAATVLSGGGPTPPLPRGTPAVAVASRAPFPSTGPDSTPIVVPPGGVEWVAVGEGGELALYNGEYSEVCNEGSDCPPIEGTQTTINVPDAPKNVLISRDRDKLVLIDPAGEGEGGSVTVVPVPSGANVGPGPNTGGLTDPPPTPTPVPTITLQPSASVLPSALPTQPTPSLPEASATPSLEPSVEPTPTPSAQPTATPIVQPSATPSGAPPTEAQSILDGVVVVGDAAAFSEDGSELAFSARPDDGTSGPDIYVWTVGQAAATKVTTDHRSVFSGWLGKLILGSRAVDAPSAPQPTGVPAGTPTPRSAQPQTFVIDPRTRTETILATATVWRPAVDPTRQRAVYWEGSLARDLTGSWRPDVGRLVVGPWAGTLDLPYASTGPGLVGDPGAPGEPSPADLSADASAPTSIGPAGPPPDSPAAHRQVLVEGQVAEWEARWDETGTHLAVWIADVDNPSIGRLSLYAVDPASGLLDVEDPLLSGEFASPGFTIGEGHVAWVTAPDQNGISGSQLKVAAWTEDGIGELQTLPGQDLVVIKR